MSTSSSSSSSSPDEVDGGGGGRRGGSGELERPSTSRISRRRFGNRVWPAPFIEALAAQVAIDAFRSFGRLSAASALFNLFQVLFLFLIIN